MDIGNMIAYFLTWDSFPLPPRDGGEEELVHCILPLVLSTYFKSQS